MSTPCEFVTTSLISVIKIILKNRKKTSFLQYACFEVEVNKRQYKVGNFLFNFSKVVLLIKLLLKMNLPCKIWYGRFSNTCLHSPFVEELYLQRDEMNISL